MTRPHGAGDRREAGKHLEAGPGAGQYSAMRKSDVICPKCNAGYRRIELVSVGGSRGQFHCLLCHHLLEEFDGSTEVALRLTVQPEKTFE
jgi:hypothetical protein